MSATVFWGVLAGLLLVLELLHGTFYLLVLAAAAAVAAGVAFFGGAFALQVAVVAVLGVGGALGLRAARFGRRPVARAESSPQALDLGQRLQVTRWEANRTARAEYRGSVWEVELVPGAPAQPGEFRIVEIRGIRLVVTPVSAS